MIIHKGYGDVKPTTDGGKLFSCVFAMLGIGIIGIALGFIAQNLIQAQMTALNMTQKRIGKSRNKNNHNIYVADKLNAEQQENTGNDGTNVERIKPNNKRTSKALDIMKQMHFTSVPIISMIAFGALVVGRSEGWNWVDSLYWCVITGTSVGEDLFQTLACSYTIIGYLFFNYFCSMLIVIRLR